MKWYETKKPPQKSLRIYSYDRDKLERVDLKAEKEEKAFLEFQSVLHTLHCIAYGCVDKRELMERKEAEEARVKEEQKETL